MPEVLSINPATEEVMARFRCLTEEQAVNEVKKSRNAWKGWKEKNIRERCQLLKNVAGLLRKNSRTYGQIITKEMGKPIKQAIAEVEKCALVCEYYAENAAKFLEDEIIKTDYKKSFVSFEPLGTILAIMPWNFPFWQVFRFGAPALAAGNTILLKHSSNVPQCAMELEKIMKEAGFPENVFKTLIIDSKTADKIIDSNLIDGVTLTGSTAAGRKIGEDAGRNIKKLVMELGGNDPFIILEDADIEFTCQNAVTARYQNTGQSCIAAKRFIVHEKIADEFIAKFIELAKTQKVGDPLKEETQVGPLARKDLLEQLDSQVKKSLEQGAKLLAGGDKIREKGYFYQPTVLLCRGNEAAMQEEIFGPVSSIIVAKNEQEAIKIANSTEYGLGASIWTKDISKGEKIARMIEAGNVYVNAIVRTDPRLPTGGIKNSGIGRELSHYGIKEFVNIKAIVIN